jgi:branched-chain amino acid transport system ATP-binding protein
VSLLEARDVRMFYDTFCALDGVSLTIDAGQFVSIIGPNGAGKTTLVNVLTGRLAPTSGRVRFKDVDIAGIGPGRLARLGMARSFQLVNVFPGLTVGETLAVPVLARRRQAGRLFAALAAADGTWDEVAEIAALFGLADKLRRHARTLPQGDKKLLDVASAFALRPEVILMDEPTSGVSTADKHAIMETLVQAAARMGVKAIIQVEHDMDIVFGYSDRVVALHQGRVLADATPEAVRADERVLDTIVGRTYPGAAGTPR